MMFGGSFAPNLQNFCTLESLDVKAMLETSSVSHVSDWFTIGQLNKKRANDHVSCHMARIAMGSGPGTRVRYLLGLTR